MKCKKFKKYDEILAALRHSREELKQKFKIKEIGVFGSYVRGEQNSESDIDILVDFEEGYKTFDNYMDLKFYLEELLGTNVDLVLKGAIREEIKRNILVEVDYV